MSSPDETDVDGTPDNAGSLISANVTDVLGFGVAAKSPAGREVAKAVGKLLGSLADPARVLFMGLTKNRVEANKITSTARAELKALRVAVEAEPLVERMKRRVVGTELRHQLNIESVAAEAITNLNRDHPNDESRPIDDQWFANWMEGAKEASADEVRSMWAKLLEGQALSAKGTVSGPSLLLMRNLDGNLARAFSNFICYLWAYGCYQQDEAMKPDAVPVPVQPKDLTILEEIGFVRRDLLPSQLHFRDFKLRRKSRGGALLDLPFSAATLTHRAHELATAIYQDDAAFRDRLPDQTAKTSTLISFIEGSKNETQHLLLIFRRKDAKDGEVAVRAEWSTPLTPPSPESFSDTLRELNANAEVSQFASDVLRGLHERGARLTFVNSP
jgi:hypothetical protein